MIASASADQTVQLWPISIDAWIRDACTLAGRNLRQEEWNEFVGRDRPYVRTCPNLPSGYGAPPDAPAATYHLDFGVEPRLSGHAVSSRSHGPAPGKHQTYVRNPSG